MLFTNIRPKGSLRHAARIRSCLNASPTEDWRFFRQLANQGANVAGSYVAHVAISLRTLREKLQAPHERVSRYGRHENMTLRAPRVLALRTLRFRCWRCVNKINKETQTTIKVFYDQIQFQYYQLQDMRWVCFVFEELFCSSPLFRMYIWNQP